MNRLVTFISIFLLSSSDAGRKEKAFEVFWCGKPLNFYKCGEGSQEGRRRPSISSEALGGSAGRGHRSVLGFGAAGLARCSPGTATRGVTKMEDTE